MRTAILIATMILAGCATNAIEQTYDSGRGPWTFSGTYNTFTQSVTIRVNDQTVIENSMPIHAFSNTRKFEGAYEGQKVSATCSRANFSRTLTCSITVADKSAATIHF